MADCALAVSKFLDHEESHLRKGLAQRGSQHLANLYPLAGILRDGE
jgi:hypothetical protein